MLSVKSCQLCKTRKVKCDRTLPSCGWCTRNNAACEYKERKKPGLRAGYGRELEKRLDRLEGILMQQSEVLARLLGQIPNGDGFRWNGTETGKSPANGPCACPQRNHETSSMVDSNGYTSAHPRPDNHDNHSSAGQHHRDFATSLPPISTLAPSHDRRPSVNFMNNPTPPPASRLKPSASHSPTFTDGVLRRDATLRDCYPHLTPISATSSSAHSHQARDSVSCSHQ